MRHVTCFLSAVLTATLNCAPSSAAAAEHAGFNVSVVVPEQCEVQTGHSRVGPATVRCAEGWAVQRVERRYAQHVDPDVSSSTGSTAVPGWVQVTVNF
jgi:hypothetical protein